MERVDTAAQAAASLDQQGIAAGGPQLLGGRQTRRAATDDNHLRGFHITS
jgi:hypothetical protein